MARKTDITAERLRSILHYDPESGLFTRMVRTANCNKVGDVVSSVNKCGYFRVEIDGKKYMAHRLAWLYMTGEFPDNHIDHRDGNPSNNCWGNLREATRQQNNMNQKKPITNNSGFKGVCWKKREQKWVAQISLDKRKYCLGLFDNAEEASRSYEGAAAILFGDWRRITVETKVTYER